MALCTLTRHFIFKSICFFLSHDTRIHNRLLLVLLLLDGRQLMKLNYTSSLLYYTAGDLEVWDDDDVDADDDQGRVVL